MLLRSCLVLSLLLLHPHDGDSQLLAGLREGALGLFRNVLQVPKKIFFKPIIERVNSLRSTWQAENRTLLSLPLSRLKRLLGELTDLNKEGILPVAESHSLSDGSLPKEFDARDKWPNCSSLGEVPDQGSCGSCWAIATTSVFTDRACIATAGKFTSRLSDQELLSCCTDCGLGCKGGFSEQAWQYFLDHGVVTGGMYNTSQGCQPYEIAGCEHNTTGPLEQCFFLPEPDTPECREECTNEKHPVPFNDDRHKVKEAFLLQQEVKEIQKEIYTRGPVSAAMIVYADFYTYKSGVYQHLAGERLGSHAVKLIGWGTENGTDFWLVVNSWNQHWGEDGLFKILRGVNECGIETKVTAGIVDLTSFKGL